MSRVIEKWACGRCNTTHGSHEAALRCCPKQIFHVYVCPECGGSYDSAETAARCHGAGGPDQFFGVGRHAYEQTEER